MTYHQLTQEERYLISAASALRQVKVTGSLAAKSFHTRLPADCPRCSIHGGPMPVPSLRFPSLPGLALIGRVEYSGSMRFHVEAGDYSRRLAITLTEALQCT